VSQLTNLFNGTIGGGSATPPYLQIILPVFQSKYCLCHSKTFDMDMEESPSRHATFSKFLVTVFPSLTQNLILILHFAIESLSPQKPN